MADRSNGYAPGRARRERLLDAAIAAFGQSGFHTATLTDIARACGISRPGLLHHFDSKEALLTAVLERRDQIDAEIFITAIDRSSSPLQAIVDIATANSKTTGLTELFAVLSAEATNPQHPAHDYFVALYTRLRTDLAAALEAMRAAGELPADQSPTELANELIALKDGFALQSLLQPTAVQPATALAAAIKRLTGVTVTAAP
ncbi:TetR/AcrR family transcriptional regulator [Microbacterium elymi]|uniref:TetR/AcrR family transcriptional regulator n=1 Tax=Microbacterium elymi TaxID=2909587 RepID=A0ABY5NLU3_9MICO|nr:TetR/AcrR family transcriptional regulator [Microbacterium elymi]UUT36135.1 TetR/AcrR family transcriptional regulator [Microbacterium elymi]